MPLSWKAESSCPDPVMAYTNFTFPQNRLTALPTASPGHQKANCCLTMVPWILTQGPPPLHPALSIVATELTATASKPYFLQVSRMNGLTLNSQEQESEDIDLDICLFVSTLTEEDKGHPISPFRWQAPFSGELQCNYRYIVNTYRIPKRIRFQGILGIQSLPASPSLASICIATAGRPSI